MFWIALLLGVVEGLTEFLPISSTGHLILTERLIGFEGDRAEAFTIFIQLGAILAVVWEHRARVTEITLDLPRSTPVRTLFLKLHTAFLPSAVLGLLIYDQMKQHLLSARPVAAALIAGGVLILIVERLPLRVRTHDLRSISWGQALAVGAAQCLSLWPGFSRSAATILGGLAAGLDRPTAARFSFFLAIPTMFGAAAYDLFRNWRVFEPNDLLWLALSFSVAFVVALFAIRWLLDYVSHHSFALFAWYRIALGIIVLLLLK
jgi:undecaprenyl-diphosphatase